MAFLDWFNNILDKTRDSDGKLVSYHGGNVNWGDAATKAVSGMTGLTGIISNGMNAARIQNTPWFDANLTSHRAIGEADYGNNDQIFSGYQNLGFVPQQDYDKVRNMTEGQRIGNTASGIMTGASTGYSIGGVPGALIGGFAGFIGSKIGQARGDTMAYLKTQNDNLNAQMARHDAMANLQAETEENRDYTFRNAYANRREDGGNIERRQMSVNEFASRVLNKPAPRVVRQKCKGGVMIKINR